MTPNDVDLTLKAVAKMYRDMMVLQNEKHHTMALMIRTCVVRLRSNDARKRKEAIDALEGLADMLEPQKPAKEN